MPPNKNCTTPCECYNIHGRSESIACMSKTLSTSIIKPLDSDDASNPITLTDCQVAYNDYMTKLYLTSIGIIDSSCMCSLSPSCIDKITTNIDTYVDTILVDLEYQHNGSLEYPCWGKCFKIECKLPDGWVYDDENLNMILISTSPNFNSDENTINGTFILINKDMEKNTILTTSICLDLCKDKELYYTIINCNFWYYVSYYKVLSLLTDIIPPNLLEFLVIEKIPINLEQCKQNININTCPGYCPSFEFTLNYPDDLVKVIGFSYFKIKNPENLCICDNIEITLFPISSTQSPFTVILDNVDKVSWCMVLIYEIKPYPNRYYEILSTLECKTTYTINPSQSKIISKNNKIFEDLSNKSQIDLNSLFNSTNNIKNSKIFEDLSNKSQLDLNSLFNSTKNINKL